MCYKIWLASSNMKKRKSLWYNIEIEHCYRYIVLLNLADWQISDREERHVFRT